MGGRRHRWSRSPGTAGTSSSIAAPTPPKARNIAANPHVAFNVRGDELGDHVLTIEGIATPDPSIPPLDQSAAYVAKYEEVTSHWGMPLGPTAREFSLAIRITPVRIRFA